MDPFEELVDLVLKWNRRINITGLKDRVSIKRELVEDSLKPLEMGLLESHVLDAGCGAGFPTLPLAIGSRGLRIVAVDSNRKKVNFLRNALRTLGLTNVEVVHGRLEELDVLWGSFSTVLSKAFLPPERAILFLKPFLKPDGKLIVYSTSKVMNQQFLGRARHLYEKVQVLPYTLSDGSRRALLVLQGPLEVGE